MSNFTSLLIIIFIVEFALGESDNVIKSINSYNEKLKLPFFFRCYSVIEWPLQNTFASFEKKIYEILWHHQQANNKDVILFTPCTVFGHVRKLIPPSISLRNLIEIVYTITALLSVVCI